jgi:hypothetical protein
MVKTQPESKFVLKSLDQINNSSEIILQVDKTESTFTESNKSVYLCEVVSPVMYNRRDTAERLTDEIIRANNENRRLCGKIERLERQLKKEREGK